MFRPLRFSVQLAKFAVFSLALTLCIAGFSSCRKKPAPTPAPVATPTPTPTPRPTATPAPTATPTPSPSPTPTPAPQKAGPKPALNGVIEAEDYDVGGEGVGYHDTTPGNNGKVYRQDDVDVQAADAAGFVVAWLEVGEWTAYTLDIPKAAAYDIDLSMDNWRPGDRSMHLTLDEKTIGSVPKITHSTKKFGMATDTIEGVDLPAGIHKLKFVPDSPGFNFNSFQIIPLMEDWVTSSSPQVSALARWENNNAPAAGATVMICGKLPDGRRWRSKGTTNATGAVTLPAYSMETAQKLKGTAPGAIAEVEMNMAVGEAQPYLLQFKKATSLNGRVVMKEGTTPVEGAEVRILGTNFKTTSDAKGEWTLPDVEADNPKIIAVKDKLSSFTTAEDLTPTPIFKGEANGPYELLLRDGALFDGRVLDDATSLPVTTATLQLDITGENYTEHQQIQGDAKGEFSKAGLIGTLFAVRVDAKGYVSATENLNVGEQLRQHREYRLEKGAEVMATVLDDKGQPVPNCQVYRVAQNDYRDAGNTGADGKLLVTGVSKKNGDTLYASSQNASSSQVPPVWSTEDPMKGTAEIRLTNANQRADESKTTGAFTGRVTDKAGKAVSGATVKWGTPWNLDQTKDTTTSDSDGKYDLKITQQNQGSQAMLVCVPAEPLAPLWKSNVVPGTEEKPAVVDFELETAGTLDVTVVDEEKKPIAGASVSAHPVSGDMMSSYRIPGQPAEDAKTDADGKVHFDQLPPPGVNLSASKQGYTPANQGNAALGQAVTLMMPPAGVVMGKVVDDQDKPITEFRVYLTGNGADYDRGRKGDVFSDSGGRFKYEDLYLNSSYQVRVSAADYADAIHTVQGDRKEKAQETIFKLHKGQYISVQTVDAGTKAPIAGVKAYLVYFNEENGNNHNIQWDQLDNQDNSWQFTKIDRQVADGNGMVKFMEGDTPGVILLRAEEYSRMKIEITDRDLYKTGENQYVVPMATGITVNGVYLAPDGQPVPSKQVGLYQNNDSMDNNNTDANGAYTFKGLKPGQGQLTAYMQKGNYGFSRYTKRINIGTEPVQKIDIGDNLGEFTLSGRVLDGTDPLPNAGVTLSNQFGWEYTNFADYSGTDGTYKIEGLKAGKYSVNLYWNPPNGGQGYRQKNEQIDIGETTTKDFNLGGGHKVTAHLVFPDGMDAAVKAKYQSAQLQYTGQDWQGMQQNGYVNYLQLTRAGDVVSGQGKTKGEFKVILNYQSTDNNYTQVFIPTKYDIDTTEKDQDLGDIQVPSQGQVKFTLTFAREEDKALFGIVSITSMNSNGYQEAQTSGLTYNTSVNLSNGPNFVVPGRFQGDYYLQLSSNWNGNVQPISVRIPKHVHADNPEAESDWGEIIVYPIYHVKARLVFSDPETRSSLTTAMLNFNGTSGNDAAALDNGLTTNNYCPIGAEGRIDFPGLYMGKYKLTLSNPSGGFQNGGSFEVPQKFDLMNDSADQDLGDIQIGAQGYVKVQMTFTDKDHMPSDFMAFMGDSPTPDQGNMLRIQPTAGEQRVGPIAPGPMHVRFIAPGFKVEPAEADVVVTDDKTKEPVIKLTVSPEGMMMGMIMFDKAPTGDEIKTVADGMKIELTGPGGSQTLKVISGSEQDMIKIYTASGSGAVLTGNNGIFVYRDLAEGDYKVHVSAPGFADAENTAHVTPGQGGGGPQMQLSMKKL